MTTTAWCTCRKKQDRNLPYHDAGCSVASSYLSESEFIDYCVRLFKERSCSTR